MNIVIYGGQATGKSILGKSLESYYKSLGHKVLLVDDEIYTSSRKEFIQAFNQTRRILTQSKGKDTNHTIYCSQTPPEYIYGFYETETMPCQWDYKYHTKRGI